MKRKEIVKNVIKSRRIESVPNCRDLGAVLLFIFLLPYIISFFFGNIGMENVSEITGEETEKAESVNRFEAAELFKEEWKETEFVVCNITAAGTERMPLETYLISRLPATVNMDYEPEALKAQTVVLRTELMRVYYDNRETNGKTDMDGKACIYVKSNILMTEDEMYEKCKEAVSYTKGMYMVKDGYPIKAPYFAVSAGTTRNGNEVFNSEDYPYLKAVACARDFTAEEYAGSLRLNKDSFFLKLNELSPYFVHEDGKKMDEELLIGRDKAGYVDEIALNGEYISGEAFRQVFSLNSSHFTIEEEEDGIYIATKGVGHGLGLCQYGANEAAKKGSDFIDILNYFFTDIVIEKTE